MTFTFRKKVIIFIAILLAVFLVLLVYFLYLGSSKFRVEREHGIKLPRSARNIQCKGDTWKWFLDKGAAALVEINEVDKKNFIAQLSIEDSYSFNPAVKGDPTKGGHVVTSPSFKTFVPGNKIYSDFRYTWDGEIFLTDVFSCKSNTGDWLHVEIWKTSKLTLLRLYTNWN